MKLVILGLGYSASAFMELEHTSFDHVTGTVRSQTKAAAIVKAAACDHLDMIVFDGTSASEALKDAVKNCHALLVSIAPDAEGDPVLRCLESEIATAPYLAWIGYLSTVGVYGDHDGAWVNEATPCRPVNSRSILRLKAEQDWLALGQASAKKVQIFRLSGIYGPGRNALVNLQEGTARRIDKPGQVFNRIHVADIAGAVASARKLALAEGQKNGEASQLAPTIINVTDHEPCPPQDVVGYGARLMGLEPPPLIPFDQAALSAMGRSFYGENKRVSNTLLCQQLGYAMICPTYREGLDLLWLEIKRLRAPI